MIFFKKKSGGAADLPGRVSFSGDLALYALCIAGGLGYAAALAPLNLFWLAWVVLLPLYWNAARHSWRGAALGGFLWGLGWALPGFRFLREIEPVVPFLLAPVLALWPALWSALLPRLREYTLYSDVDREGGIPARESRCRSGFPAARLIFYAFGSAALFTLLEWTRSRLFVWNDFSVTQVRCNGMIQLAAFTGSYGVGFVVALLNAAAMCCCERRGRATALAVLAAALLLTGAGWRNYREQAVPREDSTVRVLAVQGDLSQRRHSSLAMAAEALDVYSTLTRQALECDRIVDLVLWPESAVPVPLYSHVDFSSIDRLTDYGRLCRHYQQTMRSFGVPMLAGALDFAVQPPVNGAELRPTNSAFFFDAGGKICGRHDKFHRVPFGEYIPFRSLLPQRLVDAIDMGRDLTPGAALEPVRISEKFRAGVVICYEGVFPYVTRRLARRGANVLVALSNDAWYPRSSEPEQHLNNALMRCVETGLPMIRCGNNGGTLWLDRCGRLREVLTVPGNGERPELRRGRGVAYFCIPAGIPEPTVFVKYGEWFIIPLALLVTIQWICCEAAALRRRRRIAALLKETRL